MNNLSPNIPEGQPNASFHLFDSSRSRADTNRSFVGRFRINQLDLKNKFREYINNQREKYPLTRQNLRSSSVEQPESDDDFDIRKIRKEKEKMIAEMNAELNSSHYLEKKRQENQKTFYLLKNKCHRVESLRQERRLEESRNEKAIKEMAKQIKEQKLKYKKSVEELKYSIEKSKLSCEEKKYSLAQESRKEKLQYSMVLEQEREEEFLMKRHKCESVRQREKQVHLTVSRVTEKKKSQADAVKLSRLMYELAEKEEIKIVSSRVKQETQHRKPSVQRATKVLQSKIQSFRQSLGERRLSPQPRFKIRIGRKGFLTEQSESTHTGFPFHKNYRSYTEATEH